VKRRTSSYSSSGRCGLVSSTCRAVDQEPIERIGDRLASLSNETSSELGR
jgi:hypothetical protein